MDGVTTPLMFPVSDPMADDTALKAANLDGVPRLDAMGDLFTTADDSDNLEDEDDNPNANGAAGDRLRSIENLTGSDQKDSLEGDNNPNVLKGMGRC